ncbi:MAG: hypothetical protein LBL56_01790 [Treponema sp.]|jgi:hypothetical protein|nr:hypothetical protein [Treponema sp.]
MEKITSLCYSGKVEYGITAREKGKNVYYFINWSPLSPADRWTINARVPSVAGVYEIYWMDERKHLRMLSVGDTHYGGLRTELRRLTDPELSATRQLRQILEDNEIWFRYTPSNSPAVMSDIVWFFRKTYFPENPGVSHSGRYEKIFLQESAPNKLIWVG